MIFAMCTHFTPDLHNVRTNTNINSKNKTQTKKHSNVFLSSNNHLMNNASCMFVLSTNFLTFLLLQKHVKSITHINVLSRMRLVCLQKYCSTLKEVHLLINRIMERPAICKVIPLKPFFFCVFVANPGHHSKYLTRMLSLVVNFLSLEFF